VVPLACAVRWVHDEQREDPSPPLPHTSRRYRGGLLMSLIVLGSLGPGRRERLRAWMVELLPRGRSAVKLVLSALCLAVPWLMPLNSAAQSPRTSAIIGCITDPSGQHLPGVTVDVGGDGLHRIVQSDARGCYAVPDVPAGSHYVFARLRGFVSVTRDELTVAPGGSSQTVDLQMRVAGMCECLPFPDTLRGLWDAADAVVRVRITGHDPSNPDVGYRAALSSIWKRPPMWNTSEALTFERFIDREEAEPYAVGQDSVLFLKWSAARQVFVRMSSGGDGAVGAFAVENGRIHTAPVARYVGMEVEQFGAELRAFAR
jgi:hypothetical protein